MWVEVFFGDQDLLSNNLLLELPAIAKENNCGDNGLTE